ncbi:hypothetical protein RIF29_25259 [Crotalaria pallida]|uniref:Uncharacterized protein n=1 Tax=Crotalaria pallida TaxID=3830 RepID=A0AAN9ELT5_CROPI
MKIESRYLNDGSLCDDRVKVWVHLDSEFFKKASLTVSALARGDENGLGRSELCNSCMKMMGPGGYYGDESMRVSFYGQTHIRVVNLESKFVLGQYAERASMDTGPHVVHTVYLIQPVTKDRHEIDDLMKQIAENKLVRKSKEQDRLHVAVQSVRDELKDEMKLRKQSESIHRKLAWELCEVKSSFSMVLKELEQERARRHN